MEKFELILNKEIDDDDYEIENINNFKKLIKPILLKKKFPINNKKKIYIFREEIKRILNRVDNRLIVIVGPCSIHNYDIAVKYAEFLKKMKDKFDKNLLIIMRTYFENPCNSKDWKGFLYDPDLNNSFDIEKGLHLIRQILLDINKLDIPCASEALDLLGPEYFSDLISLYSIGARTVESQSHRQLVSGLNTPVGFKNPINGDINIAINAINFASKTQSFLGTNENGEICCVNTNGNNELFLILRGSDNLPNYTPVDIHLSSMSLKKQNINPSNIIVDFSHGNSHKIFKKQLNVSKSICSQIKKGNHDIRGIMIKSNIIEGKQNLNNPKDLKYGISITDGCLGLKDTESILQDLNNAVICRNKNEYKDFFNNCYI